MKKIVWYALSLLCILIGSIFTSCRRSDPQTGLDQPRQQTQSLNTSTQDDGRTLLHFAVIKGDLAAINNFIANGADVNVKDINGVAPLHLAANNGSKEIIEILVKKGANINIITVLKKTPLHFASEKGHLPAMNALINLGADTEAKDDAGHSPMDIEVLHKQDEAVQVLKPYLSLSSSLEEAAKNNQVQMIKNLVARGADLKSWFEYGNNLYTALHIAADRGYTEVVKTLVDLGANINVRDNSKNGQANLYNRRDLALRFIWLLKMDIKVPLKLL